MKLWTEEDNERLRAAEKELRELQERRIAYINAIDRAMSGHHIFAETSWDKVDITALRKALEPFDPICQAAQAEEPQEPQKWIEWGGGACPVAAEVMVVCKLRDGSSIERFAGDLGWSHVCGNYDIVAYRVAK